MATSPYDDEDPPPPPPPIPSGGFPDILPGGPAATAPPPIDTAVGVSAASPAAYYDGPDVAKSGTSETEEVVSPSASSAGPTPRVGNGRSGPDDGGGDPDYDGAMKLESPVGNGDYPDGPGPSRRDSLSRFVSTLCFVIGSCLYIVLATEDHRIAKHYKTLPHHVRTSDDYSVWMDYNLKKRFQERQRGGSGAARRLVDGLRGLMAGGVHRERSEGALDGSDEDRPSNLHRHMRTRPSRRRRRVQEKTPVEQWSDVGWSDLPPEVQSAFETLLTTEEIWCGESDVSPIDEYDWADLDEEMREKAEFLGYTEKTWCEDGETGEWTCLVEETPVVEDGGQTAPDSEYHNMDWSDMPLAIRLAYEALGYTDELWNAGGSPSSAEMGWDELDADQRFAAGMLGYDKASWDGADDTTADAAATDEGGAASGETTAEVGKEPPDAQYHDMEWSEIPRAIQLAYEALGYTEDYWSNGGDEPESAGVGWDGG